MVCFLHHHELSDEFRSLFRLVLRRETDFGRGNEIGRVNGIYQFSLDALSTAPVVWRLIQLHASRFRWRRANLRDYGLAR